MPLDRIESYSTPGFRGMSYGKGPTVPTYDYGSASDRSLMGGTRESDYDFSLSRQSVDSQQSVDESNNSTMASTVLNHDRTAAGHVDNSNPRKKNHYFSIDKVDEEQENVSSGARNMAIESPTYSSSVATDSAMESRLTYQQQANESTVTTASTIAVFGATTKTGQAFVRLALDAGYQVRALLGNSKKMETQTNLEWIVGSLNDEQAIEDCVRHVDFVVCTLAEHKFKKQKNMLRDFVVRLYPIMKEQRTVQVFLFQSCSLAMDLKGKTPVLSQLVKSVIHRRNQSLRDQEFIIRYISEQHNQDKENSSINYSKPSFSFLITRPSVLTKEGPSIKKLAASKSQPGPFTITHIDLAEFSLNALLNNKLHNTCPYVVADCGI